MDNHNTIFDVLPTRTHKEVKDTFRAAHEYLTEAGKENPNFDEIAFVAMLDYYIETYTKAKSMIARDRFTVDYRPAYNNQVMKLEDFYLVPIVTKTAP